MKFGYAVSAAAWMVLLTGCASKPVKKEPEKPDPPITGRQAFQRTFAMARTWARDATPLQIQSYNLQAVKSEGGKAGAWLVTYVAPSLHKSRQYTWSAFEAEGNLHKGVFAGLEQDWSGPTAQSMPFEVAAIRTDSDDALKVAMEQKESVSISKKKPDLPIVFLLEKTQRFPDVTWRVLWGESVGTSEYSVFVDASTGKYLGHG